MRLDNYDIEIKNHGVSENGFMINVGFKPVDPFSRPSGAASGGVSDNGWLGIGKSCFESHFIN